MGQTFFVHFMDWIWALRLPLSVLFTVYAARELWLLGKGERLRAALMSSYFFLVISAYWLIKPIKKALLVGYYQAAGLTVWGRHFDAAQVELAAKEINMLVALAAALAFGRLAARFKREGLVLVITAFFALGFAAFALFLADAQAPSVWLFYLYGDFFITLMVAGFFAFLNDSQDASSASRVYGLVVLGGVLGGFFGSAVVAGHAREFGPSEASLVCVGALAVIAAAAWGSGRLVGAAPRTRPAGTGEGHGQDLLKGGLRSLLRSRYLLGIACVVGLYEMVSAVMDYQFTSAVLHYVSAGELKAHFARVYSFTNFLSLVIQLFLTRLVMTRFGIKTALLLLPLTAIAGEAVFVVLPGLLFGSLLNTIDNAFSYSINQSAKEALYVPVDREEKYQAKAFIDIFILRSAKAVAIVASLLLTVVFAGFEGIRWLSLFVLGLLVVWLTVIRYLGRTYTEMGRTQA